MCVYMYVCVHACMLELRIQARLVPVRVYMYACMHACMLEPRVQAPRVPVCVYMYACMHVCMYIIMRAYRNKHANTYPNKRAYRHIPATENTYLQHTRKRAYKHTPATAA